MKLPWSMIQVGTPRCPCIVSPGRRSAASESTAHSTLHPWHPMASNGSSHGPGPCQARTLAGDHLHGAPLRSCLEGGGCARQPLGGDVSWVEKCRNFEFFYPKTQNSKTRVFLSANREPKRGALELSELFALTLLLFLK